MLAPLNTAESQRRVNGSVGGRSCGRRVWPGGPASDAWQFKGFENAALQGHAKPAPAHPCRWHPFALPLPQFLAPRSCPTRKRARGDLASISGPGRPIGRPDKPQRRPFGLRRLLLDTAALLCPSQARNETKAFPLILHRVPRGRGCFGFGRHRCNAGSKRRVHGRHLDLTQLGANAWSGVSAIHRFCPADCDWA